MADEVSDLARQMEQYLNSHDKAAKQVLILGELYFDCKPTNVMT